MDNPRIKLVLAIGLVLIAAAVGLTLTRAPMSLARRNTTEDQVLASARRRADTCQQGEVLPRGSTAIRVHAFAEYGPQVTVEVLQGPRVIARGTQGAGWTGGAVTVSVDPLATTRSGVRLCFTLLMNGDETVSLLGQPSSAALAAREGSTGLPGRVTVEYLRPGPSSWWSLVLSVARRMGLGRAPSGTWGAVLVLALMASVLALCSRLLLRELR